ncbi:hypothetical protein H1R20_g1841, partial [Candolleomyces eurysporus]
MPKIRPGWTPKQSVYLQLAAIELLRVTLTGHGPEKYFNTFFDEWVAVYGKPTVPGGSTMEDTMSLYKIRFVATIEWHAFRGKWKTLSMKAHIYRLKTSL